jgi:2-iminoacetate synthase ThiH
MLFIVNEIQAQFNGEMEIVRQNLKKKENKLKAAKDKAEVEVRLPIIHI